MFKEKRILHLDQNVRFSSEEDGGEREFYRQRARIIKTSVAYSHKHGLGMVVRGSTVDSLVGGHEQRAIQHRINMDRLPTGRDQMEYPRPDSFTSPGDFNLKLLNAGPNALGQMKKFLQETLRIPDVAAFELTFPKSKSWLHELQEVWGKHPPRDVLRFMTGEFPTTPRFQYLTYDFMTERLSDDSGYGSREFNRHTYPVQHVNIIPSLDGTGLIDRRLHCFDIDAIRAVLSVPDALYNILVSKSIPFSQKMRFLDNAPIYWQLTKKMPDEVRMDLKTFLMFKHEIENGNLDAAEAYVEAVCRVPRKRLAHTLRLDSSHAKQIRQLMTVAGPIWRNHAHDEATFEARSGDLRVALEEDPVLALETFNKLGLYQLFPYETQRIFRAENLFRQVLNNIRMELRKPHQMANAQSHPVRSALAEMFTALAIRSDVIPSGQARYPLRLVDANHK